MSTNDPKNPAVSSAPEFAARRFEPGRKIAGCYILKTRLYETQASVVWQARDDLLNRDVILHFIPDAVFADSRALAELRDEVKQNRQLIHPNTLRVYDLVEDVDCAAISMDYHQAELLSALKKRKTGGYFDPGEIGSWLAEICLSVDDAHRTNLLHRYLTPDAVLIRPNGSVLITSFGISRTIVDALARVQPGRKDTGLSYMSPQQLDGEQPSRQDDVYAFGVLVYDLVTGKPPFHTDDIVTQIRKAVPLKMSDRRAELKISGESIPKDWDKVVTACLDKSPEGRAESLRDVATNLHLGNPDPKPLPVAAAAAAPEPEKPEAGKKGTPAPAAAAGKAESPRPAPEKTKKTEAALVAPARPHEKPAATQDRVAGEPSDSRKAKSGPGPVESRVSPFSGAIEKPTDDRKSRGWVIGIVVALILLAIALMGIVSLFKGSKETERRTTREETPSPIEASASAPGVEVTPVPEGAAPGLPAATMEATAAETAPPAAETAPPAAEMTPTEPTSVVEAQNALSEVEMVYDEHLKRKEAAQQASESARKAAEETQEAAAEAAKVAEESATALAEITEIQTKLDADAEEARKAAEEKAKAAEEHKQKLDEIEASSAKQKEAMEQAQKDAEKAKEAAQAAEKELASIDETLASAAAERERLTSALTQAKERESQAEAARQKQIEESARAAAAAEEARKQREAEAQDLARRAAEAQRAAEEAAVLAEKARKALEEAERLRKASDEARAKADAAAMSVPTGSPAPLPPVESPGAPKPIAETGENSLGMKFVPVGNVLFCIWPTRVKDFESFAKAAGRTDGRWRNPGFKQAPDHPVVNVSWLDAIQFCQWLTEKELADGRLRADQTYRLPTDQEWSVAVGLPDEKGDTPEERDMSVPGVYPWGKKWPPPPGAGNYTGQETGSDVAIKHYKDGFVWTAPVGSFKANKAGLYDMGGNVWEWCMDWWNGKQTAKVLRGASWYNGALKLSLLSSCRVHASPDSSTDNYGFRVVIADVPRAIKN